MSAVLLQLGFVTGHVSSVSSLASIVPTFGRIVFHFCSNGLPPLPNEHIPSNFSIRPSDVFISVPSKSGTTLLSHVAHQLRMRGAQPDFEDIYDVVPWFEVHGGLGDDMNAEQCANPRVFKSHLPMDQLPKGGKYVYSFRDTKDAMLSLHRMVVPMFRGPVDLLPLDVLAETTLLVGGIHAALRELLRWWEVRHDPNVFFTFYEDFVEDREFNIKRLADFLRIDYRSNSSLIPIIVEQSQITFMNLPENRPRYDGYKFFQRLAVAQSKQAPPRDSLVSSVRKGGGKVGEGAGRLSPAVSRAFDLVWSLVVTPVLNFTNLSEMRMAWNAEMRLPR